MTSRLIKEYSRYHHWPLSRLLVWSLCEQCLTQFRNEYKTQTHQRTNVGLRVALCPSFPSSTSHRSLSAHLSWTCPCAPGLAPENKFKRFDLGIYQFKFVLPKPIQGGWKQTCTPCNCSSFYHILTWFSPKFFKGRRYSFPWSVFKTNKDPRAQGQGGP